MRESEREWDRPEEGLCVREEEREVVVDSLNLWTRVVVMAGTGLG